MRALAGLLLALIAATQGCSGRAGTDPPVEADLGGTGSGVAERFAELVAQARANPRDASKRAALGMAYEVNGLADAALVSYEQAVRLDPVQPRFHYYLALARAATGDLAGGLAALDAALALAPEYAPAHLYRGQWLLDLGRSAEAASSFRRATELAPEVPAGWIGLARVHLGRGQAADAVRILEDLRRRYEQPQIHQLLGLAYRELGQLDRARAAVARGRPGPLPGWPDPWHDEKMQYRFGFGAGMVRAEQLMDQGRLDEAIAQLEALRPERPGDVALLNNLSVLYQQTGRPEQGLRILEEALESSPGYFPFHLNLASAYHAQGDLERALRHLDQALSIHPALGRAHEQKGTYLMRAGRNTEALAAFDAALRVEAGRPRVLLAAGMLEADLGHWSRAVERLEGVLELDPSIGTAYVALARARAELGQLEAAERALEQAARLAPGNAKLAETRQRLEQLKRGAR